MEKNIYKEGTITLKDNVGFFHLEEGVGINGFFDLMAYIRISKSTNGYWFASVSASVGIPNGHIKGKASYLGRATISVN